MKLDYSLQPFSPSKSVLGRCILPWMSLTSIGVTMKTKIDMAEAFEMTQKAMKIAMDIAALADGVEADEVAALIADVEALVKVVMKAVKD